MQTAKKPQQHNSKIKRRENRLGILLYNTKPDNPPIQLTTFPIEIHL
ncbi:MAG: hypothetical protein LBH59_05360 [Planctomycetaceae bacterium]|nr:hypothetical protein [Planctomycetaceae bacterium]